MEPQNKLTLDIIADYIRQNLKNFTENDEIIIIQKSIKNDIENDIEKNQLINKKHKQNQKEFNNLDDYMINLNNTMKEQVDISIFKSLFKSLPKEFISLFANFFLIKPIVISTCTI